MVPGRPETETSRARRTLRPDLALRQPRGRGRPFLVGLLDSVRGGSCKVDQGREMVVAMREDDAFDPTRSGRQRITDRRGRSAVERAVAFLQPVSVEPVEARSFKRLRCSLETLVSGPPEAVGRQCP